MIITRTPFRISLFGGGTDYPGWYREHGGAVLSTTIDKYCYINARYLPPFFEHQFRVVYSRIESTNRIEEIEHPSVRATLNFMNFQRGVEIHHDGDLPARSGMGSSSSFTVGLLNALHALQGHMATKEQLANESIMVEQDLLKENVGSQDQVNAAYGGFNHITFHTSGEISVRPVIIPPDRQDELTSHLMLFYTGIKRTADKVAGEYVASLEAKRRQLRILRDMVEESLSILCGRGPIKEFGELLHEGWLAKQSISDKISNAAIAKAYNAARDAGAIGGKITGAGGGGFMLLFVPPQDQPAVREKLSNLLHVPFQFEKSGSQVIFYDRDQDYSAAEADNKSRNLDQFRELDDVEATAEVSAGM
ncbi:MAG TPA: kinase [Verrucomicrobiales bacterium]|nr:kinase [Verrucomicrobiales bacterium]